MDLNNKKIMIVNCCGLGDLIMFTPLLKSLKKIFPACYITFLCRDNNRDVLSGLPYVDKVTCIYRGKFLGRYRAVPEIFNQDMVIFTDWQPVAMIFAKIFRIPIIAGHIRAESVLSKCFNRELHGHVLSSTNYAAKTNADIISEFLNVSFEGDMTDIEISNPAPRDIQSVDKKLKSIGLQADDKFILLTPFTGFEQRNLSLETAKKFVELVEENYKLPVVITGPANKQHIAEKISKYTLTGATSLLEFVEIVNRAEILITPDSGPMHVAGALKKNCVAIFSKDIPSRWAPRKNCLPLYLNLSCSPCDDETARNCPHLNCMRGISADMIFAACKKFL